MKHTFNIEGVKRLIAHAKAATEHRAYFLLPGEKPQAGLHLVGDHGVYLMSTGNPRDLLPPAPDAKPDSKPKSFVVYADQCNPETMEFDDWWAAKHDGFGGDDGCELIPLEAAEHWVANSKGGKCELRISPGQIATITYEKKVPLKAKVAQAGPREDAKAMDHLAADAGLKPSKRKS